MMLTFLKSAAAQNAPRVPTEVSNLSGKIAFQRQTQGKTDAVLYVYDLSSQAQPVRLNDKFPSGNTIHNTVNPQFSSDGKTVLFGGISGTSPNDESDIFICNVDGSNLRKLAGSLNSRDEDPKFSPDGRSIIYKHNTNQIWIMNADGTRQRPFVNPVPTVTERSMPVVTADGKTVLFTDGIGADEDIYSCPVGGGTRTAVAAINGLEEYYPTLWTSGRILYTQWSNATAKTDQIYKVEGGANTALPSPLNLPAFDSSDPFPINDHLIMFSSTRTGSDSDGTTKADSTYDLYIGDAVTGQIWSFQTLKSGIDINTTTQNELGAAYWVDKSTTTVPAEVSGLRGKIAFQRQTKTSDTSDAKIYLYDLGSQTAPICLNDKFPTGNTIHNTINPQISLDGKTVLFGGISGTSPNDESDIFICNVDGSNLRKLAGSTSSRDEDPKFSPDGRSIIYKHNKTQIYIMNVDGTKQRLFVIPTPTATERSMPFVTADGKTVLFTDGVGTGEDIYKCPVGGGARVTVAVTDSLQEYYPIPWTGGRILYTRWVSTSNMHDQIYMNSGNTNTALPAPLNTSAFDSSDPAPINDHLIVFSSTRTVNDSGGTTKADTTYDLYIGNTTTGQIWSFQSISPGIAVNTTTFQELGATYWIAK